jgi:hypothetical protein
MQLVDELSMIYTTCLMVWGSYSISRKRWGEARTLADAAYPSIIFARALILLRHHLRADTFQHRWGPFYLLPLPTRSHVPPERICAVDGGDLIPVILHDGVVCARLRSRLRQSHVENGDVGCRHLLDRLCALESGQCVLQLVAPVETQRWDAVGNVVRGPWVVAFAHRSRRLL